MRLTALRSSRLSLQKSRKLFPATTPNTQDVDVFANSLRKTLDAHRSSNRARLIRKVYPRPPPAGIWRPEIPLQCRPEAQPVTPPEPTVEESDSQKPPKSNRRRRVRNQDDTAQSRQIQPERYLIRSSEPPQDGSAGNAGNCPWLYHLTPGTEDNGVKFLNAEVLALEQYLTPSSREQACIDRLNAQVTQLLSPVVPHTPQLIGSRQLGLALSHSDLNFLLPFEDHLRGPDRLRKPSATRPQIQEAHLRLLQQVESIFEDSESFGDVRIVGKRHSVLEARHHSTGLLLRFHCGEKPQAIMCYINTCMAQYPTLRPLYLTTRALLEARGLFGSSHAGIRPDALVMLLVAFMKLNPGFSPERSSVGEQLLAFLRFYGTEVDLQSLGIAVEPAGFFGAEKAQEYGQGDAEPVYLRGQRSLMNSKRTAFARGNSPAGQRLCIQDPTHYMNDLGRSCTRTAELQEVFSTAHRQLDDASNQWKAIDSTGSILGYALRANFDQLEALREQLVSSEPDLGA